jgi:hypothetical protein
MAFGHAAITVATTPTLLCRANNGVVITNGDAQSIFIGQSDVAVSGARKGATLGTGTTTSIYNVVGAVYAVSSAGTSANAVSVAFS